MKTRQLFAILFSLGLVSSAWADAYSNAYGQQAMMSPGGIPSTLSLNNNGVIPQGMPQQMAGQPYGQMNTGNGGGVYLNPANSMSMNAMPPQSMANMAPYSAPQASQYYGGQPSPQAMAPQQAMQMPNAYYNSGAQMPQTPNIGAFAVPDNSYLAVRPQYGVPENRVQRNSSNSMMQGLPYRATPNIPLNANSGMNQMNNTPPKTNSQLMSILGGGGNGQNATVSSILGAGQAPSTNNAVQTNNPNWVQKVFTRPAGHKVSGW